MSSDEHKYFLLLKVALSQKMCVLHPEMNPEIQEWKSREIALFQEELHREVQSQISEKWFYTHIKSSHHSLPRIDILDLLSRFAGYQNWSEFKLKHGHKSGKRRLAYYTLIPFLILLFLFLVDYDKCYEFCFISVYSKLPVSTNISITVLRSNETPLYMAPDEEGCICISSDNSTLSFQVSSPYHRTDTVLRTTDTYSGREIIMLQPDEYTQIIRMFAHSQVDAWYHRKSMLIGMFYENAKIYQVSGNGSKTLGIYNTEEFINRLTMPTSSLKELEIVEAVYNDDRIAILKFKIMSE